MNVTVYIFGVRIEGSVMVSVRVCVCKWQETIL